MEGRPPPSKTHNKDKPSLSSDDTPAASSLKAKTKPSNSTPLLDLNATSSSSDLSSKPNPPDNRHTHKPKATTVSSSTKEAIEDFPEIRAYYEE
jgi:hypothetical protein